MITRRGAIFKMFMLLVSSSIFLNSCFKTRRGKNGNVDVYRDLISEVSEVIIPQTDTPGAKEAGVSAYIIRVIESCLSDRDKKTILSGLNDVEEYSRNKYSLAFTACSEENKIAVLDHFQNRGSFDNAFLNKVKNRLLGPSFFELIKSITVKGYCTSQIGATQGLAYEHIPISYVACTPLFPNQRSWATA